MQHHTNDVQLVPNEGWDKRILVCRNGSLVDTFIVVTDNYVILIDTVINPQTAEMMLSLAEPHLVDHRRLLVVNTHADYDHAWGNQLFVGAGATHPAPIVATRLAAEYLRQPEAAASLKRRQAEEPDIFGPVILTPPTLLFEERFTIDGGDLTLELFATPGHTPDHISLYIPEINTLLAADGAELPFPLAHTVEGLPLMRQSLARMAALDPAVVLYCHAPVTIGPQLLRDNIAYFDELESRCREALVQGVPSNPGETEDVAALIGYPFEQAVPQTGPWQQVNDFYRYQGHARQIRMMLEYLAGE